MCSPFISNATFNDACGGGERMRRSSSLTSHIIWRAVCQHFILLYEFKLPLVDNLRSRELLPSVILKIITLQLLKNPDGYLIWRYFQNPLRLLHKNRSSNHFQGCQWILSVGRGELRMLPWFNFLNFGSVATCCRQFTEGVEPEEQPKSCCCQLLYVIIITVYKLCLIRRWVNSAGYHKEITLFSSVRQMWSLDMRSVSA